MIVYKYLDNGEFESIHECQPCPITKGWLYPSKYTDKEPPVLKDFEKAIFVNNKWTVVKTNIGKTIYNKTTQEHIINTSEDVPDEYTLLKPVTKYDDWNGTKWVYNKDKHIADKIQQVKDECKRFIYSLYPIEKQLQMTFQYNKILKTALERELTPDEEASKLQLENLHAWYEGIIAQSHAMEADITGLTTHEDIEAYDITFKE